MSALKALKCVVGASVALYAAVATAQGQGTLPLTRSLEAGPIARVAEGDPQRLEQPMYYYNGDKKVYLSDSGLALVMPSSPDLKGRLLETKGALPAPDNPLAKSLTTSGYVVVSTRQNSDFSLITARKPMAAQYLLPIVVERSRPFVEVGEVRSEPKAMAAMTPEISIKFSPAFMAKAEKAEKLKRQSEFLERCGLTLDTAATSSLRIPDAVVARPSASPITFTKVIDAANKAHEEGRSSGAVVYAKPNFIRDKVRHGDGVADPHYSRQWYLNNTGQGQGAIADADVDAPEAWQVTTGKREIKIAIIDDSVQRTHPDLAGNFIAGKYLGHTPAADSDDPSPRSGYHIHGTCCAGIAVASSNSIGIRGVAPSCGLIGVHFWDALDDLRIAQAFYFAADPDGNGEYSDGAAVISCSWGLNLGPDVPAPIEIVTAIEDVSRNGRNGKGVVVLFSAGNSDYEIGESHKLAALEDVVCVGASNCADVRSLYSNYGLELDVLAPSNDVAQIYNDPHFPDFHPLAIDTTDNTDDQPRIPNDDRAGYAVGDYTGSGRDGFGGTSAACPLAGGTCGLILSANPDLYAYQVRSILEHCCDRIRGTEFYNSGGDPIVYDSTTGHNKFYGFGRINAFRGVLAARESVTSPGIVWPNPAKDCIAISLEGGSKKVQWSRPMGSLGGVLVVTSSAPIEWRPADGDRYEVGDIASGGTILIVATAVADSVTLPAGTSEPLYVAVYPYSREYRYAWGRKTQFTSPPEPAPEPPPAQ